MSGRLVSRHIPGGLDNYHALLSALAARVRVESLRRIAARVRIDNSCLSRFLRGERDLTFYAACRLAEYLGLGLVSVEKHGARKAITPRQFCRLLHPGDTLHAE